MTQFFHRLRPLTLIAFSALFVAGSALADEIEITTFTYLKFTGDTLDIGFEAPSDGQNDPKFNVEDEIDDEGNISFSLKCVSENPFVQSKKAQFQTQIDLRAKIKTAVDQYNREHLISQATSEAPYPLRINSTTIVKFAGIKLKVWTPQLKSKM